MMDFSKFNIQSNKKTIKKTETLEEVVHKAKKQKDPDFHIKVKRSASFGYMGRIRIVVTNPRSGYVYATSIGTEKNKKALLKKFAKEYKTMGKIKIIDLTNDTEGTTE